MALFSSSEITTLDLTSYSDLELEALEDDIYQLTKNDFGKSEIIISGVESNVITIYDEDVTHGIEADDQIRIYIDDIPDYDGIFTVTATTDTTITIAEDIPDIDDILGVIVKVVYPAGLKVLAAKYLKSKLTDGVTSERVGRYAVTYNKKDFDNAIKTRYGKYFKRSD